MVWILVILERGYPDNPNAINLITIYQLLFK